MSKMNRNRAFGYTECFSNTAKGLLKDSSRKWNKIFTASDDYNVSEREKARAIRYDLIL